MLFHMLINHGDGGVSPALKDLAEKMEHRCWGANARKTRPMGRIIRANGCSSNDTVSPMSVCIDLYDVYYVNIKGSWCSKFMYRGRFAPSPTGPLHLGSLATALASWLDARMHAGQWLIRIEDVDTVRSLPGLDQIILRQLAECGLHSDEPPTYQSTRTHLYKQALDALVEQGLAYPCSCTRKDIKATLRDRLGGLRARHQELIYPGTCRTRPTQPGCWRVRTDAQPTGSWVDRRLGLQSQDVGAEVGDFVIRRADGCFTYQLAVVVDDAHQGITDVVRGEDLVNNTARQMLLQQALGLPSLRYLHTPLARHTNGEKLSKQNGATAVDTSNPMAALNQAAKVLGLPAQSGPTSNALLSWIHMFGVKW